MIVLELFPCSGGMAEGLRRAGLKPTISFDWDEDACDSYENNLGDRPIRMDVRDLLRLARDGWRPLERVDLLVADPPCTPWSRAGKRKGTEDERDLIEETVELVRVLRPRAWLIANVPGLDDGPNWQTVQRTIGSLAGASYCIDFARLNAADYGVPQHRVRPFWYGHATSEPHAVWPARTHGSPDECINHTLASVAALRPWVTCREALSHLPPDELGTPIRLRWRGCKGSQIASVPDRPARVVGTSNLSDGNVLAHPTSARKDPRANRSPGRKPRASHLDEPAGVVTCKDQGGDGTVLFDGPDHRPSPGNGGAVLLTNHKHPINRLDEPSMTVCTKGDMQGAQGAAILEWPWERPSTSVTVDERIAPPGHSSEDEHERHGRARHNAVKLSEKAAAILQGFPDGRCRCERDRWANEDSLQRAQTASTSTRDTSDEGTSSRITSHGKNTTAPSPTDSTSTTRTKTRQITESKTSNCSLTTSTQSDIAASALSTESSSSVALGVAATSRSPKSTGTPTQAISPATSPARSERSETASDVCERCGERRRSWHFAGKTKSSRWAQIGMAMPPPLAEAVARSIARALARRAEVA